MLQQVADDDRELGRLRVAGEADVSRHGDDRLGIVAQAAGERGHQRVVIAAVDLDQVARVGLGQLRLGGQEAPVARLGRQPRVGGSQPLAVVGADRPDLDFGSIGQGIYVHQSNVRQAPGDTVAVITVVAPVRSASAMADRTPEEIWEESLREGERRLSRSWVALAATGVAGGSDVMFGIVAVTVASAGLAVAMPAATAHVVGSLLFGLGFVFITIGRAELFTENFLIPVGAVVAGLASRRELLRMWAVTLVLNFVALAIFGLIFSVAGVLPTGSLHAAGAIADTLADRSVFASLMSAVAAGVVMTVFTWITTAAESATGRIVVSLLVGFLLSAPILNHAVVGFGELFFGLVAGTTHATWADLAGTVGIAVVGNFIGGVGLVFTTRLAQVGGHPTEGSSESKSRREASEAEAGRKT